MSADQEAGTELELRGALISLRPYRLSDRDVLARIANNRKVWRNLTDRFPHPYTRDDARQFIAMASRPKPSRHLAIERESRLIGAAGFDPLEDDPRSAEVGYWLAESSWGHGYATEAAGLITAYAFSRWPLERLQASVYEWNTASMRVLTKAGYTLEAVRPKHIRKDGQLIDVHIYVRLRDAEPQ